MDAADIDAPAVGAGVLRDGEGVCRAAERTRHAGQLLLVPVGGHDPEDTYAHADGEHPDLRAVDAPFHEFRLDVPEALHERLPDGIMIPVKQVSLDILRERLRDPICEDRVGVVALHALPVPVVVAGAVGVIGIADKPVALVVKQGEICAVCTLLEG